MKHRMFRRATAVAVAALGLSLAAPVSAHAEELLPEETIQVVRQLPDVTRTSIPGTNGLFEYLQMIQSDGEVVGRAIARTGASVDFLMGRSDDDTMSVEEVALAPVEPSSYEEALNWAYQMSNVYDAVRVFAEAHGINGFGGGEPDDAEGDLALMSPETAEQLGLGTHAGNTTEAVADDAVSTVETVAENVTGEPTVIHVGDPRIQREQEPGYIYDSGCAEVTKNSHRASWGGCFVRYTVDDRDTNAWYSGDESTAAGHGTGWYRMYYGDTQHRYGKNGGSAQVVKWAPSSTQETGKCKTVTTKLTLEKTELSQSYDLCPDKINPYHKASEFKTVWQGGSTGRVVATAAENFIRIPNSTHAGFEYWVRRKYGTP